MQQAGLTRQDTIIVSSILWFTGLCAILAFIGTVLAITTSVDHVTYPFTIKVIWDTINVLLVPVAYIGVNYLCLSRPSRGMKAFLDYLFLVIGPCVCIYMTYKDGSLSAVLFVILVILFLILWVRTASALEPRKKITAHVDGSDDLPPPPSLVNVTTRCTICKAISPYDICLGCEVEHKSEIHKVRSHNMRAKKVGEPATLTIAQWLETLAEYQYRCAYCPTGKYEVLEHYFPLGSHDRQGGTTALNCVPACKKCNLEKSNKHPEK